MADCQIAVLRGDISDIILMKKDSTEFGDKAKIIQPTSGLQYKSIQLFLG